MASAKWIVLEVCEIQSVNHLTEKNERLRISPGMIVVEGVLQPMTQLGEFVQGFSKVIRSGSSTGVFRCLLH